MVDGSIVTEERFDKIRKFACTFWMALKAEGNPPPKWAGASMDIKNRYYGELRSNYPELKLCDNNWKADYIASLYYGHWYNYHITHKQSAYINSTAESVSTTSRKRRRTAKSVSHLSIAISCKYILFQFIEHRACRQSWISGRRLVRFGANKLRC